MAFLDVTLDLGSFISDFAGPVLEAVGDVLRAHGIDHDDAPEPPEGIQGQRAAMLGVRVAEAIVPGLDLTPRRWDPSRATTTALGPLGHVYFPTPVAAADRAEP